MLHIFCGSLWNLVHQKMHTCLSVERLTQITVIEKRTNQQDHKKKCIFINVCPTQIRSCHIELGWGANQTQPKYNWGRKTKPNLNTIEGESTNLDPSHIGSCQPTKPNLNTIEEESINLDPSHLGSCQPTKPNLSIIELESTNLDLSHHVNPTNPLQ